MIFRNFIVTIFFSLFIWGFVSCNSTRRLGEGEYLLVNHSFSVSKESVILQKKGGESFIQPSPNRKMLGFWRIYLQIYNLPDPIRMRARIAQKELKLSFQNEGIIAENRERVLSGLRPRKLKKYRPGFSELFQRFGEPPVLLDSLRVDRTRKQLALFAKNKGYLQSEVRDSIVIDSRRKRASVYYNVRLGPAYQVENYRVKVSDPSLEYIVMSHLPEWYNSDEPVLFDLDKLDIERERVASIFREYGYYGFDKERILYSADTLTDATKLTLTMEIDDPDYVIKMEDDSMAIQRHLRFKIGRIYVVSDFDPTLPHSTYTDSTVLDGIIFLHNGKPGFNPEILSQSIFLKSGGMYHPRDAERTRSSLSDLRSFRYINLRFRSRFSGLRVDSLDCYIDLSPSARQDFSVEAQGTNTDGNLGVSLGTSYRNKNLFGGAEILEFRLTGGAEVQVIQGDSTTLVNQSLPFNTLEVGGEISLTTPKFIAPFRISKYAKPRTRFLLSMNYQNRPDFSRTVSTGIIGYEWALPPSRIPGRYRNYSMFFQFNPLEISVIDINKTASFENFLDSINDQFVRNSFRQHYIQGLGGSMWMSNKKSENQLLHYYYRLTFSSGGNALRAFYDIFLPDSKQSNGNYEIFGIQFAQFLRIEQDFRYYITFARKKQLAFRGLFGLGVPFGNTNVLPFEKSFFAGGANDLRAWLPRTLGPGGYSSSSSGGRVDQVGDIKLLGQIEYRYPIYKYLEGAFFADAGNIWLLRKDIDRPLGHFEFSRFWDEFALGAGVGLRLNLGFFVFRFDVAAPFRDPTKPVGSRWVIGKFDPSNDLRLNIGIGFPF